MTIATRDVGRDVRLAWRTLRRTPGFTLVTIASLGLGFALTASTMAVVNAYLIRSLPYPAADRLYHVIYARPGQPEPRGMALIDWRSLDEVVDVADTSAGARFHLTDGGSTQEVPGLLVAPGSLGIARRVTIGRWQPWLGLRAVNALNSFLPADVQANIGSPAFGSFYNSEYQQFRIHVRFEH